MTDETIEVLTREGRPWRVNGAKFRAMAQALMSVLPDAAPGITPAAAQVAVLPLLPADLFPGGEKAGWWLKAVQLDHECRGLIARADRPPVRLHRV
jgi:hypothetical protein